MDARKKSQQAQPAREDGLASQTAGTGTEESPEASVAESARQNGDMARSAGQNLFAAKFPPAPYRGINRNLLFALGGTVLLCAGGAGYLWHLNSSSNTRPLRPAGAPHAAQIPQADLARETVETAPQNTLLAVSPTESGAPQKTPPAPAVLPVEDAHDAGRSTKPPKNVSQAAGYRSASRQTRDERPMPQPHRSSPVSIGQQQAEPVDTLPGDAYLAYRSGKLDEARQLYLAMFRKDARNPDALLGLAAIAQRHGENLMAAQYFSQVLMLDPRNAVANAGMSALSADDDNSESRLKTLLREQGNSAVLHFALGNIYAGQSRWSEAQQAYFNAYMLEPGNAGFAFNLAVSLDQLGQGGLAVQHYRRALELDQPHGAGFDRAQISQRIEELARHENAD